jgi:nicotinamide-nucleotide amidase
MARVTRPLATAEVVAVGSELLGSTRLDTNSLFLSERLGALGIVLRAKTVVGDDRKDVASVFSQALSRADLVICTGGLGPTADDLTREAVADVLGLELTQDPDITAGLERRFAARGLRMPAVNIRQAMVPRGATVLDNPNGSAPGLYMEAGHKVVVLLPGPPRELQPMFERLSAGALGERAGRERLHRAVLFVVGRGESHVEELAQPLYSRWMSETPPIETTILAAPGQVELHLTLRSGDAEAAASRLRRAREDLIAAIGPDVFSTDGRSMEEIVGEMLRQRRLTIAVAESCTGGLVMSRLTDIPGSSAYVTGGVVAYSNEVKIALVGVPAALIEAHGAVSEPVAMAMADGIRERTGAHIGIGVTGIAGPGGGSEQKPVGTVAIAVSGIGPARVRTFKYFGSRAMVKFWSAQGALEMVRRVLISLS